MTRRFDPTGAPDGDGLRKTWDPDAYGIIGKYPNSPVVDGVNTITWDTVGVPKAGVYIFDKSRILGIKFHLQATTAGSESYGFTIRDLTFVRQL